MNTLSIPSDIIINILVNLPIKTLLTTCQSNKKIYNVCNNDYMWRLRITKEFGPTLELPKTTWKDWYFKLLLQPLSSFNIKRIANIKRHLITNNAIMTLQKLLIPLLINLVSTDNLEEYITNNIPERLGTIILAIYLYNIDSHWLEKVKQLDQKHISHIDINRINITLTNALKLNDDNNSITKIINFIVNEIIILSSHYIYIRNTNTITGKDIINGIKSDDEINSIISSVYPYWINNIPLID